MIVETVVNKVTMMVYKSYYAERNGVYFYLPSDSNNYLCSLNGKADQEYYYVGRKVSIIDMGEIISIVNYIKWLYKDNGI